MKRRVVAVVALVALAVGVAVGALLAAPQQGARLDPLAEETAVAVDNRVFDGEISLEAAFELAELEPLNLGVNGRVTSWSCEAGEMLESGDTFFAIDGNPVTVLHTETPFWRTLSVGDKGADVAGLQTSLMELGFELQVTGEYDWGTAASVAELINGNGGGVEPAGVAMQVEQFLWIPRHSVQLSECGARLGENMMSGEQIAAIGGNLVTLTVNTAMLDGEPRVLQVGDRQAQIPESGQITDPEILAAAAQSMQFNRWEADRSQPVTFPSVLSTSIPIYVIPPAAVIQTRGSDEACLNTAEGGVWVTIVGSELGQTFVSGSLPQTVLVGKHEGASCS